MNNIKIGIMSSDRYRKRLLDIAAGRIKPSPDEPKIWFESMESLSRVLSTKNMELLSIIAERKPESLTELSEISGREVSNLSRTLKTFSRYGVIHMQKITTSKGRKATMPVATANRFTIEYASQA